MRGKHICNKDIREYAKNNDVPLFRIAMRLGGSLTLKKR